MYSVSDGINVITGESFYAPEARLLAVDDTEMNLIVMKGVLKHTGIQIDTATDGKECLFLAERNKYHIIFLDIYMPEMDGYETLRRLMALEVNIPVIALTADDTSLTNEKYIEKGFSDYLPKPVDSIKLKKLILKYLPGSLVREMKTEDVSAPESGEESGAIPEIAGLDTVMGIRSCGSIETFKKTLKEFYITASDRIQEIEHYIKTENYIDYTIKVHALKSSARLIGANRLSDMARYLEECGNQNIREIKQKTVELTEYYRELTDAIGTFINKGDDNQERSVIERESFMEALRTIYEFVEAFDFESADSIMEMLEGYSVADEYCDAMQKLKVMLIDAKRDDIMRHISTMEKQSYPGSVTDVSVNIPDIDEKSAIEALGGSTEDYIKILKVFSEDEKVRIKNMDECLKTKNIELYTVYAHSLKSSAAIIGAAELSRLAKQLETAGKERNWDYIRENHNDFTLKMNHLIDNLVSFLQLYNNCEDHEYQIKEYGSNEYLLESLVKIKTALTNYDMNATEDVLNQLTNMQWSITISNALAETGQKMLSFDYEDARVLVDKLLKLEEIVL